MHPADTDPLSLSSSFQLVPREPFLLPSPLEARILESTPLHFTRTARPLGEKVLRLTRANASKPEVESRRGNLERSSPTPCVSFSAANCRDAVFLISFSPEDSMFPVSPLLLARMLTFKVDTGAMSIRDRK